MVVRPQNPSVARRARVGQHDVPEKELTVLLLWAVTHGQTCLLPHTRGFSMANWRPSNVFSHPTPALSGVSNLGFPQEDAVLCTKSLWCRGSNL